MKNKLFRYSRMITVITIVSILACSIAWISPAFSLSEKSKLKEAAQNADATTNISEETQLTQQLENDGLINQVKGFVVEKKQNKLFVNGALLPDNVAGKYISALKKDEIRVEVYPFIERLRLHPDAGFIQVLFPVMLSSPCVDYKPKDPGC